MADMINDVVDRYGKMLSTPWVIVLVLALLAFVVRIFGIGDGPLRTDEIYHLLAGRSWAEFGTLAMGDGSYTRAKFYSIATGWFFELFGTTPGVGRALAAVGGTLLVAIFALWMRAIGTASAAWVSGLLLCFNYTSITLSQFARFYTWHALALFVLAIAVYAVVTGLGTKRIPTLFAWAVTALLALAMAMHLQTTTFIMVLALGAWTVLHLAFSGRLDFILRSPVRLAGAIVLIIGAVAVVLLLGRGFLLGFWKELRSAAAWSEVNQDDVMFYITALYHLLGWLFALLPVAIIIAWKRYRQPVLFCVVIVAVCIAVHSIAGMKAVRYVLYVFPFIFAVWGLAFSSVYAPCLRYVSDLVPPTLGGARHAIVAGIILLSAALAFVVVTDFRLTATAAARGLKTGSPAQRLEYGAAQEEVDWKPHLDLLRSLQNDGLFIATDSVRTLYFLGDYDLLLSKSELSDISTREFAIDKRTGKPDISTGRSIEQVVRCYPRGSLIVSDPRWRSANVTDEAADVIEREMRPVPLPEELNMRAFTWKRDTVSGGDCAKIYSLIGTP